jgi:hypothetical protein
MRSMRSDERVFMVGNGPSLSPQDLNMIAGEVSFGLNGAAKVFPYTRWRPTYYVGVSSASRDTEFRVLMQRGIDAARWSWVWQKATYFHSDKMTMVRCTHAGKGVDDIEESWWSDNPDDSVCNFGTSMIAAMQVAAQMRFRYMILLGVDCYWTGEFDHMVPGYRTPGIKPDPGWNEQNNREQPLAYDKIARPNLERLGIRVLNATRGGRLEVWPRVMLEEVLAVSNGS